MRSILIYSALTHCVAFSQIYLFLMIICVCGRLPGCEIAYRARTGIGFDDIHFKLGVVTQCGRFEGCARNVVAQCNARYPAPNISSDTNLAQAASWNIPAL